MKRLRRAKITQGAGWEGGKGLKLNRKKVRSLQEMQTWNEKCLQKGFTRKQGRAQQWQQNEAGRKQSRDRKLWNCQFKTWQEKTKIPAD